MTIFRKANNGELKQESGLQQLFQSLSMEIDVAETGVKGAKEFFEAQVSDWNVLFCFFKPSFNTSFFKGIEAIFIK